ncbi:MAG: SDR family NAD(P)-dependent oxidoreductase, partial [Bacteroidia bacterium]
MKKLINKTAVVTGAASGMGKAIAQLFAQEGANVIVADLKQNEIDEVVSGITKSGGKAIGIICNVANENEIKNMVDQTLTQFKTIDILVNNAGIMDDFIPVDQVSNELWNRVMSVNINGPFYA